MGIIINKTLFKAGLIETVIHNKFKVTNKQNESQT